MTTVIEKQKTELVWTTERAEFRVALSDLEQIVIQAPKYTGYQFDPQTTQWVRKADEVRKIKLTHLNYALTNTDQGEHFIKLVGITGNFFNKGSNRVGIRDTWLQDPSKEVIDQIPDHYHNFAREHISSVIVPMFQSVINTGLVIGEK